MKNIFIGGNYCYDYGDNWHFTIICQGIEGDDGKKEVPSLLESQGHYLMEDSGGIWGFSKYLEDYKKNKFDDDIFENNKYFRGYMKPCFKEVRFVNHHKDI